MIALLLILTIWLLIGVTTAAIALVVSYTRTKCITVSDVKTCLFLIIAGPIAVIAIVCVLFDEHNDFVLIGKKK